MTRVLAPATAGLLAWALFFGEATSTGRLAWIGGAAALAVAAAFALDRRPAFTHATVAFLALLGALVVWQGLSILWSTAPDRSWDAFNRGLVYLAFFALGLFVARLGTARAALTFAALLAAVAAWALLGRVFPSLADLERVDRLRSPIGYWNMLAFLLACAVPLGLWLARRRQRLAGVALLYLALSALLLTNSRAGVLVAAVAFGVWLWLAENRRESVALAFVAAAAAGAVAIADADGAMFAAIVLLGLATVLVAAHLLRPDVERWLAGVAAAAVVVGLVAGALRVGNPSDEIDAFTNPATVQRPEGELLTVTSNNRWIWWTEAWEGWRAEPVAGTGAGSFELTHRRLRENELNVREPHSLPLEVLTETGLVGVSLLLGAYAAAAAIAAGALRRLRGDERAAAVALVAAVVGYALHSLVDLHWSYVAASAPVLVALGVLAAAGLRVAEQAPTVLARASAAIAAVGALYSLGAPALAERGVDRAYERLAARDARSAVEEAESARLLNPLAVEPLFVAALAEDLRGQRDQAHRLYLDAVALQPDNWRTWYELGQFEFEPLNALDDAFLDLDKAYSLDPRNVAVQRALDRVRDRLEGR